MRVKCNKEVFSNGFGPTDPSLSYIHTLNYSPVQDFLLDKIQYLKESWNAE